MKILNFSTTKLRDIPKQDNPIYRDYECMLIVKGKNENEINLIHVNPYSIEEGKNKRIGIFYNESVAMKMAECYIKN